MTEISIQMLSKQHAAEAARLHREGIQTGFLSSLGQGFLKQLYKAIQSCPSGFGFVCLEGPKVLGFVACCESTGRLYKQALLRRGILMALPLARFLVRPSVLKHIFQTLRYPSQVDDDLPDAEILSIVVSRESRRRNVGKALMEAALAEFARRGIDRLKVAVWTENQPANEYYVRCGFALAARRTHHGLGMNIYTISTAEWLRATSPPDG